MEVKSSLNTEISADQVSQNTDDITLNIIQTSKNCRARKDSFRHFNLIDLNVEINIVDKDSFYWINLIIIKGKVLKKLYR